MHNIATSPPPVVGQDRALSPITTAVLALAELQMHCCGGVCGYCISSWERCVAVGGSGFVV